MRSHIHNHHIIPKHDGGCDEDWNKVKLTLLEHADAHFIRWVLKKQWQDELAFKTLTGQITHAEAIKIAQKKPRRPRTLEERQKISAINTGRIQSESTKQKRKLYRYGPDHPRFGMTHTDETKALISAAGRGRIVTLETRLKHSMLKKGIPNLHLKGKPWSEARREAQRKMKCAIGS